MMKRKIITVIIFTHLFSVSPILADVKLASLFGDHMVLQQDMLVPVWGTADPGEQVTIELGQQKQITKAESDGK